MKDISVLIVDDEKNIRDVLMTELPTFGFRCKEAERGAAALSLIAAEEFDVVLLDLNLPDMTGFDVLKRIQAEEDPPEILVLTADAAIPSAVEAIKLGAYDYLVKPIDLEQLSNTITQASEKKRLRSENLVLRTTLRRQEEREQVIAESPAMRACLEIVKKVAGTEFTVLIQGESGAGKEVVAREIHRLSARSEAPFIAINCGAIPETMIESELFGFEKGAFTGAHARKLGLLELASSGTLFLDEIGDMPPPLQVKLLRVIETGAFFRLGGTRELKVDVRIISATNKTLSSEIEKGRFRSDFFYRITGLTVAVPPLRERKEDIPVFIEQVKARSAAFRDKRFTPEAVAILMSHGWPGNVRELQNVVQRTLLLSPSPEIRPADLPHDLHKTALQASELLADIEREHIMKVLSAADGQIENAARLLGIHPKTLRRKLTEYGVAP